MDSFFFFFLHHYLPPNVLLLLDVFFPPRDLDGEDATLAIRALCRFERDILDADARQFALQHVPCSSKRPTLSLCLLCVERERERENPIQKDDDFDDDDDSFYAVLGVERPTKKGGGTTGRNFPSEKTLERLLLLQTAILKRKMIGYIFAYRS